jgi:hypothetical protein
LRESDDHWKEIASGFEKRVYQMDGGCWSAGRVSCSATARGDVYRTARRHASKCADQHAHSRTDEHADD